MRLTIDYDSNYDVLKTLLKLILKTRRLPHLVRKTKRGWHFVFANLNLNFEDVLKIRREFGEDEEKLIFDTFPKPFQILFNKKEVWVRDREGNLRKVLGHCYWCGISLREDTYFYCFFSKKLCDFCYEFRKPDALKKLIFEFFRDLIIRFLTKNYEVSK